VRLLIGLLLLAALAAGDVARLRELAGTRQLFLLRETLQQPGWNKADTLFYRGMVASRFGREREGIDDLVRFLASHPSPDRQREAYEEVAAALARVGRFGEAARNLTEALRVTPADERADNANKQNLYAALAGIPPQSVAFGRDVPVRATFNELGSWDVPVAVNGRQGQWIFDTGANWSTLSAGEAKRLGLEIRESDAYVGGSTGKRNALRLAVASDLRLGRAHLKHVVFLVLSDEALFVGPLKYQIRGILGLPVIRALGRVRMAANGGLQIEPRRPVRGAPNMFFDGLSPIVEVRHDGRRMQMFLDTGANASSLYRSFRSALTKDEIAGLTAKDETTAGAGGIVVRRTEVVRTLRLFASGRPMDLSNVSLLTTAPEGDARYRDGVLGIDAVRRGFTLDFRAMQFRLE
jgi:predicted aspartyl protease